MKTRIRQKTTQMLKSAGLRQTVSRKTTLSVLLSATSPLTQKQIAAKLPKSTCDKVTIYRTLENLFEKGLVR